MGENNIGAVSVRILETNIFLQIRWWDWILVILFLTIFILLLAKGILGIFSISQTNNNQNASKMTLRRNAFWLYCSGTSLLIAFGILIGLPIENLRCWLFFIPTQCFLLPWIVFNLWGIKIQTGWNSLFKDLLDNLNIKKRE